MKSNRVSRQYLSVTLAVTLGLFLIFSLMMGVALAQEPEQGKVKPGELGAQGSKGVATWLILDTAQPVETVLPSLLNGLAALKAAGLVIDFEPTLQRSAPTAVPGVRVVAEPANLAVLRRLPGVLDVNATLPPPPPSGVGLLGTSGTITGRVTDAGTSTPLADLFFGVRAYDAVSFAAIGDTGTDSNGIYQLAVTAPYSQVKIFFDIFGYLDEWHNNLPFFSEATVIPLPNGSTTPNINGALERAGTISGTLTLDGGGPAAGVSIITRDSSQSFAGFGLSDPNGQFVVSDLPTDTYKLNFLFGNFPGIVEEWYQDQDSFETATPINVTAGVTETITAQVTPRGVIAGLVTDTNTAIGLTGVEVAAFDASDDQVGSTSTGFFPVIGGYQFALDPGTYRVRFKDALLGYNIEYHNNKPTLAAADLVTVTSGVTTVINAALTPATGRITGTITKDGGTPLATGERVDVDLFDAATEEYLIDFPYLNFVGDGVNTTYAFTVAAGTYKVNFFTYPDNLDGEWFDNKDNIDEADPVTVPDGGAATNISADLAVITSSATLGCITGTLTSDGALLTDLSFGDQLEVSAYDPANSFRSESTSSTDANGVYKICDLESGTYLVSFSKFPSATTWYDGQLSRAAATTVTVTAAITTPNIDGALDDLGACISGKVVDLGGQGIPDANFQIYDAAGNQIYFWEGLFGTGFTRSGDADADGGFVACGLAAGTYTIQTTGDLAGEGGPVTVTTGETVGNITVTAARRLYLPIILK